MRIEERTCCKCGHKMRAIPESEWHLFELASIDYICPNCLHVYRVEYLVEERRRGTDASV